MKICPQCESGYHDSHTTCPTHGGLLSEIRDLKPGMLIRDTYRIKSKLGKGGMGSVYLAQQTIMDEPRALKFLSQELSEDEAFTSRFLREVRTLRQVRNRNVVDCGDPERAEDGSLFFSMEFVDGPNLRDLLKTSPKPFDVRLALAITRGIAEGLGAAHSKGMVHRDIKPENILMAKDGEVWVPKIADFGIVATKETSQQTRTGSALLTMAYAAPEQWTGTRAADLDGRTDLYALGGVLFEMLTGQCVFDAENYHGWAQMHLNNAPQPPSNIRPDLKKWRGLDALVLRLLAKDRNDRPKDYAELIKMLDAVVYDPSLVETAAANAPTVMYTPPGPGQTPSQAYPVPPAIRQQAETSLPIPVQRPGTGAYPQDAVTSMGGPVERPSTAGNQTYGGTPDSAPAQNRGTGDFQTLGSSSTRQISVDSRRSGATRTISSRTSRGAAVQQVEEKVKRGIPIWTWIAVLIVLGGLGYYAAQKFYVPKSKFRTLQNQSGPILSVAFSPDGLTLASVSHDNTIQLWDVTAGKALNTIPDHADSVAFGPNGRYMATGEWDKSVKLWDVSSGSLVATMDGHTEQVVAIAFSPDGRMLASGSRDKTVKLWDVAGDKIIKTLQGHTGDVQAVAFSPDGRTLASGSADNTIKLWDVASGKELFTLQGHTRPINSVAFSPDGHTLASGSDDNTVKLWDVAGGKESRTLQGHTDAVRAVAYNPDGLTLASGSSDNSIRIWDANSGALVNTLQSPAAVLSLAYSPNRITLASGSADNSVYLWVVTGAHN
jgi:WD40 repeat protein/tRNA A-37 threonylcarbamoyl transferase component Bud32